MTEPQRKHALLSPSGAEGWMTCAGKPLMEKGLPDNANSYSDEGTCAHAVAALHLTEGEPISEYVGRVFEVGEGRTYTFRADMVEPVQVYVDTVRSYQKSLQNSELFVEVSVPIDHVTGEEGATGTADAVLVSPEEIICIDLKFGAGVEVSAERNKQAMLYALGAIRKLDVYGELRRARMVISQPRISPKPSEWDCTVEELEKFADEAMEKATTARLTYESGATVDEVHANGLLVPSEKGCQFCRAKSTCPALAALVVDDTEGFEVANGENPTDKAPVDLAELGAKFRRIPLLELYIKAIRAKAEATLFEMGNSTEAQAALGIKIVQGKQGNRAWSDDEAAAKMLKHWRLKDELIYKMDLKTPTQIEKVLKEHGKPKWREEITALVTRAPGKPSVAPLEDPRPAISVQASDEGFTVTEEQPT